MFKSTLLLLFLLLFSLTPLYTQLEWWYIDIQPFYAHANIHTPQIHHISDKQYYHPPSHV